MAASSRVINERYAKSGTNFRGRTFLAEKGVAKAENQGLMTDLEHHLEGKFGTFFTYLNIKENWVSYLQYFQEALKYNITQLQEKLNLDPQVIEITKKVHRICDLVLKGF